MSISGVGSYAAGNLSQMLSTLLSKLDTTTTSTSTSIASSDSATTTNTDGSNALTGRQKPSLSSMILGVLIGMQASDSASASSTSAASSSPSDPVQGLFSAMDSDANGTVSQSELEGYIEQKGGSQSEADTLYGMLDTSGSGISESQLASDVPQGPPPSGFGATTGSASDMSEALLKMFDTNGNGSVSKSEFENVVTSSGGTAAEADTDFAALDTSGSDSVGASDFAHAIEKLQDNSNSNSPLLMALDAFAKNTSSTTGTVSLSA